MRLLYNKGDRPAQNDIEEGDDVYNLPDSKRYTKTHAGDIVQIDSSPLTGYKNLLINGGFDVWQRGESFTDITPRYTADRWHSYSATPFSCHKAYDAEVGNTIVFDTGPSALRQVVENNSGELCNTYLTLSFYIKSPNGGGTNGLTLRNETDGINLQNFSYSYTTEWTKIIYTFSPEPSLTKDKFVTIYVLSSTVADGMIIAQAQLELGDTATSFERRHIALEESLCGRYYQILNGVFNGYPTTKAESNLQMQAIIYFTVSMRVNPTSTQTFGAGWDGDPTIYSYKNHINYQGLVKGAGSGADIFNIKLDSEIY